MNNTIKQMSLDLNIKESQITAALNLLDGGNTIPFISRYRKEATGALDEEQLRKISEVYNYQVSFNKRKEDIIRLIEEKELMTEELKKEINEATKLVELEDIYRPFKEKKKTKASEAVKNGLEPLAKIILSFNGTNIEKVAQEYLNEKVKTVSEALMGAKYIISEYISDNAIYRKWIRTNTYIFGTIVSKIKKEAIDEKKLYEMYYDYTEQIKRIKPHRILAINRGESEKVLNISLEIDDNKIFDYLEQKLLQSVSNEATVLIKEAIRDSYKRLIKPSIEREIRSDLTELANISAINNFSKNLERLLMTPPMKEKMVLGLDPAYRTGCKLAVIDKTGQKIFIEKIYPHEPVKKYEEAKQITIDLINKYDIDIVAIGNGTASRESEAFIVDVIKELKKSVKYIIVSEAGASVYSASKLAIEEFPDLHVEERSAISIGRRLQDPLAELVKIDPESIGVGLYQHDIPVKELSSSLDFVVSKVVNQVGVNINTASVKLLSYVSGLNKTSIEKIQKYKKDKGKIYSRSELKKILSSTLYTQAIGFLRIPEGENTLDATPIHPESYDLTLKLLNKLGFTIKDIGSLNIKDTKFDIPELSRELKVDEYTLQDIEKALKEPMRDLREDMPKPILKSDILHLEDLKRGDKLEGTVRNVVDFGAFIDIGLKNDGLVHISKISKEYIKHPLDVLNVGDIVTCYVDDISLEKQKVGLTLLPM